MERFKLIPEVCFVWIRDGKILLGRRANTGWQDGRYCFPAGHGEDGETMTQACAREVFEEVGIKIDPQNLKFLHTQHRWNKDHSRVGFYFAPIVDPGEFKNMEPEKCDDLQFFTLDALPEMVAPFRIALDAIQKGEIYSEYGWEDKK
jgi:8-oxo-dGTP diphosphatase